MAENQNGQDVSKRRDTRRTRRHFLKSDVPGALGVALTGTRALNLTLGATFAALIATSKLEWHEYEFFLDFIQGRHDRARIAQVGYYNEVV